MMRCNVIHVYIYLEFHVHDLRKNISENNITVTLDISSSSMIKQNFDLNEQNYYFDLCV